MILTARTVAQVDSAFHANCQEFTSWVGGFRWRFCGMWRLGGLVIFLAPPLPIVRRIPNDRDQMPAL